MNFVTDVCKRMIKAASQSFNASLAPLAALETVGVFLLIGWMRVDLKYPLVVCRPLRN